MIKHSLVPLNYHVLCSTDVLISNYSTISEGLIARQ